MPLFKRRYANLGDDVTPRDVRLFPGSKDGAYIDRSRQDLFKDTEFGATSTRGVKKLDR